MLVPWTGLVVKALPRMNFFNTCVVTYLAICEANHLSKIHLFTDWFHPAHIVFCFPQGTDAATRGVLYKKMFLFLWSGREKRDSGADVFFWILRNFVRTRFFYRAPPDDFWVYWILMELLMVSHFHGTIYIWFNSLLLCV